MLWTDDRDRDDREGSGMRGSGPENLIKDFITQRSIQTLLRNLEVAHEFPKADFLEKFLDHSGVTDFHGYGALRVGWKHYLSTLRKTAPFEVTRTKTVKSRLSPDNPYAKDTVFEYKIEIDPVALADDLFEIRSHLAEEWQADLQLIPLENAELFRHYNAMMVNASDDQKAMQHPLMHAKDTDSPLRKANYDLLEKYVTHVAVVRVQWELSRSKADRRSHQWLREYMALNGEGFEGDHGRNVGRSFVEKLLLAPPVLITDGTKYGEGEMVIIDPMDIAARVMAERQCVADMWVKALSEIEEDHLKMHRAHVQDCFEMQISFAPDELSDLS